MGQVVAIQLLQHLYEQMGREICHWGSETGPSRPAHPVSITPVCRSVMELPRRCFFLGGGQGILPECFAFVFLEQAVAEKEGKLCNWETGVPRRPTLQGGRKGCAGAASMG